MAPLPDGPRIVVTGLGLVLPQGIGPAGAEPVFAGRSAVRRLPGIDGLPNAIGAPAIDFVPLAGSENTDRAVQFALSAADQAWTAAGLAHESPDPNRIASVISLSKGSVLSMAGAREHPFSSNGLWRSSWPDAAAVAVARRWGLEGPVTAPVTACASGGHALLLGASLIRRGRVDAAIVGAAEASLHPLVLGSYHRMGVLAPPGSDPASAVRPFSSSRRGFAIGEGAGVLIIESEASARRRGVQPLAEIRGWAAGSQATSLTDIEPTGDTMARVLTEALARARMRPQDIDYINAHGTATMHNDAAESRAIHAALGKAAGSVSVSSTKGSHGHLLGAATAVELVLTVMAMTRGLVPPTANLTDPDPAIGLDCTPLAARRRPIRSALKMATGFGGHVVAVVLAQPR
jgi:3-oxoacyl-(acyl-carrier-protein) synthase